MYTATVSPGNRAWDVGGTQGASICITTRRPPAFDLSYCCFSRAQCMPLTHSPLGRPTHLIRLPAFVQEFPTGVTNGAEWYPVYGGMQVALLSPPPSGRVPPCSLLIPPQGCPPRLAAPPLSTVACRTGADSRPPCSPPPSSPDLTHRTGTILRLAAWNSLWS